MQESFFRKTNWSDVANLDDFYINNAEFAAIRQALDSDIDHPVCQSCWADEHTYGSSMRTHNTFHSNNITALGITHVDLRLSNKCNLQCKMCNPYDSSQLAKIAKSVDDTDIHHPFYNKIPDESSVNNVELLNLILKLPQLDTVRLAGGEPFIMPEVDEFLHTLVQLNKTDISIEIITNCTTVNAKIIALLTKFKRVDIKCSIDGVGDTFEYQRYPAKWKNVETNFMQLYNSTLDTVTLSPCIGLLNYLSLDQLFEWANNFPNASLSYNEIYDPSCLNFRYVPLHVRAPFYEKFSAIDLKNSDPKWQQFQKHTMYEYTEPTQDDCNMLYQYAKKVWDPYSKLKFLDLYPWAEYMIARATQQ
jgi:sulfatase maturation enzyme AslB (radical SAM superfamily)